MRCTNVNRMDDETMSKVLYDEILFKVGEKKELSISVNMHAKINQFRVNIMISII